MVYELLEALRREERVVLATVIGVEGSSPAASGTMLLVKNQGRTAVGTVGGGCMESDVLREAGTVFRTGRAVRLRFTLSEDHPESGMTCGGDVEVLIEPVTSDAIPVFETLAAREEAGEDSVLTLLAEGDGIVRARSVRAMDGASVHEEPAGAHLPGSLLPACQEVFRSGRVSRHPVAEGEWILVPFPGKPPLIIFGAGHIARHVSVLASRLGFRVTVVDDREEFANPERFPDAERTIVVPFAECRSKLHLNPSTYVLIVTRGHRSDEEILSMVLGYPARYVGMIGSKRKVLATYRHLLEKGTPESALRHVHAPVGISIGAVSPEEIAVSIVAEMIQVKRGDDSPPRSKSEGMGDLLRESGPGHG